MTRLTCRPDPATPGPSPCPRGWRRARLPVLMIGVVALAAQLLPMVHAVLAGLIATSWTLIAVLAGRTLARRCGLRRPGWLLTAPLSRLVAARPGQLWVRRRPPTVAPAGERECYELAAGPTAGQR